MEFLERFPNIFYTIIKEIISLMMILILTYLVFLNKNILSYLIIDSFYLWFYKVFPFLFMMIIIEDLLINYHFANYLIKVFYPLAKLLNLSLNSLMVLITSFLTGVPSSTYLINKLLDNKEISIKEANNLLMFTYFNNPLFLINILTLIFNNNYQVIKIMIIHYLSNLIIAFIYKNRDKNNDYIINKDNQIPFPKLLINSIKNSLDININVFSIITFFNIISSLLIILLNNPYIILFIKGLFEITNGLNYLILFDLSIKLKEIITMLIISFGGLSIHLQVYAIISDSNLKYKYFLKGRLLAVLISLILIIIF